MSLEAPDDAQLALALFDQQPEILKKPVQAVHMAITGGQQNKTQRLAFNAMLKHAHDVHAKNPGIQMDTYSISRIELMRIIDYTSPNRKHLKEALTQMQNLKVQWDFLKQDGEAQWASCVLLPYISFDKEKVYYSYAPQIKPMLFDPKIYARLDLRIQRKFVLDCAAALYEWVNRFRNNPSKRSNTMPWEDWRWVIYGEIQPSSVLTEYKMFKREKLKPAILEINDKSDLKIELVEDRDGGRSVRYLQFIVEEKPFFKLESDEERDTAEWDKKLEEMGLGVRDRKKILSKYSNEVIDAHYRYTLNRVKSTTQPELKNAAAYFKKAIEANYVADVALPPAPPASDTGSLQEIQTIFINARNLEAEALFNEMEQVDQEHAIDEYNSLQQTKSTQIPAAHNKRIRRYMAPFFTWFAMKTWGEPTTQEVFDFALKTGAIVVKKP